MIVHSIGLVVYNLYMQNIKWSKLKGKKLLAKRRAFKREKLSNYLNALLIFDEFVDYHYLCYTDTHTYVGKGESIVTPAMYYS